MSDTTVVIERDRVTAHVEIDYQEKTFQIIDDSGDIYELEYAPDPYSVRAGRQYNSKIFQLNPEDLTVITITDSLLVVPAGFIDDSGKAYVIIGNTRLKMLNDMVQQNIDAGKAIWNIEPFVLEFTTEEESLDPVRLFQLARGSNEVQAVKTADRVLQVVNYLQVLTGKTPSIKAAKANELAGIEFGISSGQVANYAKIWEILQQYPAIGQLVDNDQLALTNILKLTAAFTTFKIDHVEIPITMDGFMQKLRERLYLLSGEKMELVKATEGIINEVLQSYVTLTPEEQNQKEAEKEKKVVQDKAKSAKQTAIADIRKLKRGEIGTYFFDQSQKITRALTPMIESVIPEIAPEIDSEKLINCLEFLSETERSVEANYNTPEAKRITIALEESLQELSEAFKISVIRLYQLQEMIGDKESDKYVMTKDEAAAEKKRKAQEKAELAAQETVAA